MILTAKCIFNPYGTYFFLFPFYLPDESGCEADMAEGGQEDDSGDVKTNSPHKLDAGDAPLNLKSEVSPF